MNEFPVDERALLSRYLLGDLEEKEAEQIAERTFMDRNYFDLLEQVEDQLIDRYIHNQLETTQRAKFEKHFLTSEERVRDVQIAHLLAVYREQTAGEVAASRRTPPFWSSLKSAFWNQSVPFRLGAALATGAVILIPAIITALLLTKEDIKTTAGVMIPKIVRFNDRGPDEILKVAKDVKDVALFLAVDSASERYTVELQSGSNALWRQEGLTASSLSGQKVLVVRMPRSLFAAAGDYTVAWQAESQAALANSARYRVEFE